MSWRDGVFHSPTGFYLEGTPALGQELRLRLRIPRRSPVRGVYLRHSPDGEEATIAAERAPDREGYDCDWWEVAAYPRNKRYHYRFLLLTDEGGWWLTATGLHRSVAPYHTDFQLLVQWEPSPWLDGAVFYQIFPDRFAMGQPENRVRSGGHLLDGKPVVARKWGELPDVNQGAREFYGGDLEGIRMKLSYLQDELGVDALYLNPIFTAPSSHKYDCASYREVDPHFGGDEAFLALRRDTSERGMKLILDIVPNHCGVEHPWFQEALRDANAETAEFFTFYHHPTDYDSWLGIRSLPKLTYKSQRLRDEMYLKPDSIMRHWLRPPYEIDGWRVDVANMLGRQAGEHLGHKVFRGMRRAVKESNPECYFLGENFFDATAYLQGDQLDASMNYRGFMMPLYHWLGGRDYHHILGFAWGDNHPLETHALDAQWRDFRTSVPWAVARRQLNLLDSHDTPRLLTLLDGDRARAAVARFLLFTYPGVPCVYYGDEVGLEGGRDPDNRRCMPWDRSTWDDEWWEGWKQLIGLRRTLPALREGTFQTLLARDETLVFLRESPTQRVVCVARRASDGNHQVCLDGAAIADGALFEEVLGGARARVEDRCLPLSQSLTQLWVEVPGGVG